MYVLIANMVYLLPTMKEKFLSKIYVQQTKFGSGFKLEKSGDRYIWTVQKRILYLPMYSVESMFSLKITFFYFLTMRSYTHE